MTLPGKYRKVAFVDVPYKHEDVQTSNAFAKLDSIMHSPVEMEIRADASWRLDFEGASRWGWHSYNAHQVAFTSGIWVMMTQTLVPTRAHQRRRLLRHRVPAAQGHLDEPGRPPHRPRLRLALPGLGLERRCGAA